LALFGLVPSHLGGDDPAMPNAKKKRRPRAKQGELVNCETPVWTPLLDLARIYVDEFMWMGEIELKNGTRIQLYKHWWTRRYLHLDAAGRAYTYCDPDRYREIPEEELLEIFDRIVGRWDPSAGIPRYTRLYDEGDGFDAS
jgi:hypothetical protein